MQNGDGCISTLRRSSGLQCEIAPVPVCHPRVSSVYPSPSHVRTTGTQPTTHTSTMSTGSTYET